MRRASLLAIGGYYLNRFTFIRVKHIKEINVAYRIKKTKTCT